jgi:NAD(P)-dependent dehydrogenase (short-subunit alcohol dehydrogenase family)
MTETLGGVAIVTGGTFGIGREITKLLARRGHRVVAFGLEARQLTSLAENGIASLTKELTSEGLTADLLEADVSQAADVERVVAHTLAKHGRIDALVNNAAIGPLGTVLDTSEEDWDQIMAVNLKGPYLMARAAIPQMQAQGGGRIINIGSGAGHGKPNMAVYAASKGGLHTLTMAMAYDHFQDGIRVNTVIPGGGGIATGMSLGRVGGDTNNFGQGAPGTAAGRVANGEDIARAVAFLLSDDAEVLSGTVIDVGCFADQGGPIPKKAD